MIAVWIVGGSFLVVGLLVSVPRYVKFILCRGRTHGVIRSAGSAHGSGVQPIRAVYEYEVEGTKYRKSTGWTNYALFRVGGECTVRYNVAKPGQSYITYSGQIINCALGTLFAIVGIVVFCLGAYLRLGLGL